MRKDAVETYKKEIITLVETILQIFKEKFEDERE